MKVGDMVRYATEYRGVGADRTPAAFVHGVIISEGPVCTPPMTIWYVLWSFPEGPKAYGVHDHDIEVINESR